MSKPRLQLIPLEDRGPLRVMFLITSMPVGGAETLLVSLVRGMSSERFWPSVCCLKARGLLGDELADDVPVFHDLIRHKYDLRVLPRLTRLFRDRRVDAVVTVGAGEHTEAEWIELGPVAEGLGILADTVHRITDIMGAGA